MPLLPSIRVHVDVLTVNAEGTISLLQCTVRLVATPEGHASNENRFVFHHENFSF